MWQNLYLYIANDLSFRAELSLQRGCHLLHDVARRHIAQTGDWCVRAQTLGSLQFFHDFHFFFLISFQQNELGYFSIEF